MKNGDFPAFACASSEGHQAGLTKRELIAAMVLQGIMANTIPGSHHRPDEAVRDAVERADALLAALDSASNVLQQPNDRS